MSPLTYQCLSVYCMRNLQDHTWLFGFGNEDYIVQLDVKSNDAATLTKPDTLASTYPYPCPCPLAEKTTT